MPSKRSARDRKSNGRGSSVPERIPIVCIGASAGGLDAFGRLLEELPPDTGMAYVIIQHLDPSHPSSLPPLLAKKTPMPVSEARDGVRVKPNTFYVIPPDTVMSLSRGTLRLAARTSEKRFLPIDHFMRSLAEDQKGRAIGVILSGTASDGTLGLEAIKAEGGLTFAQDEKSAQYGGMPSSARASGCVDFVLPPAEIARELVKVSRHPYVARDRDGLELGEIGAEVSTDQFSRIFEVLRRVAGIDFSSYKRTTIRRRISRRMTLNKFTSIDDYVGHLLKNRSEVDALSQDLLIKVTTFFRDPESFQVLQKKVLPAILKHRKNGEPIRAWVPGCSTGEEVYSIGMSLIETMGEISPGLHCQIFATDISDAAIERARSGFYPESIKDDVAAERLRRFFIKTAEGYRISKTVRDMCIFARQDLTKDPPFSKLDLISCRNVLIYMGSELQKRIIPIFHYSLKPGGYLMLGSAESPGSFSGLFTPVDKKGKIYLKKPGSKDSRLEHAALRPDRVPAVKEGRKTPGPVTEVDLFREADKLVLGRFAPAGVLLNAELEVVQYRGRTSPYLENAPGKPTVHVLKLIREGLVYGLRSAVEKALKQGMPVRSGVIEMRTNGNRRDVVLDVVPIRSGLSDKPFLLVLFNEIGEVKVKARGKGSEKSLKLSVREETRRVMLLRRELNALREELQTRVEEQEAAQEEFKSANEEILSSNEELQSTNEELETAKEELQSANEELTTLNEELMTRNTELGQLNSDITNLLAGISIPILMLSQDLRIRRFTPVAGALLNLIPSDVGRPITDINPNIDLPRFEEMIAEVIDTMIVKEQEVRAKDGRWYSLRIRPYRTVENKIDGATVTFLDIDARRRDQEAEAFVETVRTPVLVLDSQLRVKSANRYFYRYFETSQQEILDQPLFHLAKGEWNVPALRDLLENVIPKKTVVEDFMIESTLPKLGRRTFLVNARRMASDGVGDGRILLAFEDVTAR
ncbi:MAG TPA: chemotaxis protein CheB [Planctomycetota bacterium]|nr:chemotaxis protein CheB [Planctomycetota bacterium]